MHNNFKHIFLRRPEAPAAEPPEGKHFVYAESFSFPIEHIIRIMSRAEITVGEIQRKLAPGDAVLDGMVVYLVEENEVLATGSTTLFLELLAQLPAALADAS